MFFRLSLLQIYVGKFPLATENPYLLVGISLNLIWEPAQHAKTIQHTAKGRLRKEACIYIVKDYRNGNDNRRFGKIV